MQDALADPQNKLADKLAALNNATEADIADAEASGEAERERRSWRTLRPLMPALPRWPGRELLAVVVPSPTMSLVFEATSRTSCAPMFSNLSESSISLPTVTPSLVMRGAPKLLSRPRCGLSDQA
jgi:hypothetical protein